MLLGSGITVGVALRAERVRWQAMGMDSQPQSGQKSKNLLFYVGRSPFSLVFGSYCTYQDRTGEGNPRRQPSCFRNHTVRSNAPHYHSTSIPCPTAMRLNSEFSGCYWESSTARTDTKYHRTTRYNELEVSQQFPYFQIKYVV